MKKKVGSKADRKSNPKDTASWFSLSWERRRFSFRSNRVSRLPKLNATANSPYTVSAASTDAPLWILRVFAKHLQKNWNDMQKFPICPSLFVILFLVVT